MRFPPYVLITPARDEAQFIELTIRSVVKQTVRPSKWIVVSDGSTDGTDEIVKKYAASHAWIELVRLDDRRERHFAGKVHAFNAGYDRLQDVPFEIIGSLDADVSFDEEYFQFLLQKLSNDASLGLVGTPFVEGSNSIYDYRFTNIEHVSGACQLFRRRCFEDIGGYVAVRGGCIDHIAVLSARMNGWKTRTFTEKIVRHYRTMGTAQNGVLISRFKNGTKDYAIGNHPIWELFRACYQMTKRPFVVGGLMIGCGYLWPLLRRAGRPVSPEMMAFQRREQMLRLRAFVVGAKRADSQDYAASQ